MKAKIIIALAIFTSSAFAASAQTAPAAKHVSTLPRDRARIKQGAQSGELTRHETRKLAVEDAKVHQERKDVRADGTVTPDERKDLRKDKKKLSKNIYQQKHDAQTRP